MKTKADLFELKTRMKNGEMAEFDIVNDGLITTWFNSKWNTWVIEMNAKVVHSSKVFKTFERKLISLL